jgi:hypothetical protein
MATATKTKPKKKAPTVRVTLSTFDDTAGRPVYRRLRERSKLAEFQPVTAEDYQPCGMTPLIDATVEFAEDMLRLGRKGEVQVGLLLDESGSMQGNREAVIQSANSFVNGLREVKKVDHKNDGKGFLVVATDGYENASRKHHYEEVRKLLASLEDRGWVVIFLGASIDAWGQGHKLGLSGGIGGQTVSTVNTPVGTQSAFVATTNDAMCYLTDNQSYKVARAGSTVRSLSEDGKETPGSTGGGITPGWGSVSASTAMGTYDPSHALRKATEDLSG